MSGGDTSNVYHLVERGGPGGRRVLRGGQGDATTLFVVAGFQGSEWPRRLTNPVVESRNGPSDGAGSWRLSSNEGRFDFGARAIDRIELRPGLYDSLHRPFALTATDRVAVRLLLALLRLPGGARLIRLWHARRSA